MSRPAPSSIVPISPIDLASHRPIVQAAERDLIDNDHYLWCHYGPTIVLQHYRAEDPADPYIETFDSNERVHALWRRAMLPGFTHWRVSCLVENTSGSAAGIVKAVMQAGGGTDSQPVGAGTSQWTEVKLDVPVDATQSRDTLELLVTGPTSGVLRIHSVMVRPVYLTSVAAGLDASGWEPHDTQEVAADLPLTVHTRAKALSNADIMRRKRSDSICHWSEDIQLSQGVALETGATDYVLVAVVPYKSDVGEESIEWAVGGYGDGATGSVRLTTDRMVDEETSGEAVSLSDINPPITAVDHDDGGNTLDCWENHDSGWVKVELKSNGAMGEFAYLMSLNLWFANAT